MHRSFTVVNATKIVEEDDLLFLHLDKVQKAVIVSGYNKSDNDPIYKYSFVAPIEIAGKMTEALVKIKESANSKYTILLGNKVLRSALIDPDLEDGDYKV